MPRIMDAYLVKDGHDTTRPAGVTATQPQAFQAVSFPTLVEIHLVCTLRATWGEFGHSFPLTGEATNADGFPVSTPMRTSMHLDTAKRTNLEGVQGTTLLIPAYPFTVHEPGLYRLVLHMPGSPSFVVPFDLLDGDVKPTDGAAHDPTTVPTLR